MLNGLKLNTLLNKHFVIFANFGIIRLFRRNPSNPLITIRDLI